VKAHRATRAVHPHSGQHGTSAGPVGEASRHAIATAGAIAPSRVAASPNRRAQTEPPMNTTSTIPLISGCRASWGPNQVLAPARTENTAAAVSFSGSGSPPGRRESMNPNTTPGTASAGAGSPAPCASPSAVPNDSSTAAIATRVL
jgi:hypothetical protein